MNTFGWMGSDGDGGSGCRMAAGGVLDPFSGGTVARGCVASPAPLQHPLGLAGAGHLSLTAACVGLLQHAGMRIGWARGEIGGKRRKDKAVPRNCGVPRGGRRADKFRT